MSLMSRVAMFLLILKEVGSNKMLFRYVSLTFLSLCSPQGGVGPWAYDPMEVRSFLEKMK